MNEKLEKMMVLLIAFACVLLIIYSNSVLENHNQNENTNQIQIVTALEAEKINLNTATLAELVTLPYVGEVTAQAIIDHRPYTDVWQLAEVPGIGATILQAIIEKVEV